MSKHTPFETAAALALTALLVTSMVSVVAVAPTAASGNTTALDDDTALTEESVIEEYEEEGVVTVSETVPDLSITVADSAGDVDVHGLRYTDYDTTYLRFEYDESIERTVRVYVPREYWHPHPSTLDAVDGDASAQLTPTEDGNYTAVEIHFDGETDAVFEVRQQASLVFSARDHGTEWLSNETGVDIPAVSGEQDQWEYLPAQALANESAVGIDTEGDDVRVQYDASNTSDPTDQRWRTIPPCSSSAGGDAPVCTFENDHEPDRINVLAQTNDPPDVRYHHDAGFFADLRSSGGELFGDIPGAVLDDARDFLDGVLS